MTDPTPTSETGATVVTAEKTIGQVVHEATVAAGDAEGDFDKLEDSVKADLEKFGKIIEGIVCHMLNKPVNFTNVSTAPVAPAAGQPE